MKTLKHDMLQVKAEEEVQNILLMSLSLFS